MKLTDAKVKDLPTTGNDQFLVDADLPGFGLRVRKSGAKFWAYQFKRHGRLRRVVLGRIEVLDSTKARTRAKVAQGKVADGQDPTVRKVGVTCDQALLQRSEGQRRSRWRSEDSPVDSCGCGPGLVAREHRSTPRSWRSRSVS